MSDSESSVMPVNCWQYSRDVYLIGRSVKQRPFTESERNAVSEFIASMATTRPAYVPYINLKADNPPVFKCDSGVPLVELPDDYKPARLYLKMPPGLVYEEGFDVFEGEYVGNGGDGQSYARDLGARGAANIYFEPVMEKWMWSGSCDGVNYSTRESDNLLGMYTGYGEESAIAILALLDNGMPATVVMPDGKGCCWSTMVYIGDDDGTHVKGHTYSYNCTGMEDVVTKLAVSMLDDGDVLIDASGEYLLNDDTGEYVKRNDINMVIKQDTNGGWGLYVVDMLAWQSATGGMTGEWSSHDAVGLVGSASVVVSEIATEQMAVCEWVDITTDDGWGGMVWDGLANQNDYSLGKMVQKIGRSLKVQFCTAEEKGLCDALFNATGNRRFGGDVKD